MYNIAIDFGTTNTIIGVYNIEEELIDVVNFSGISKKIGDYKAITSTIGYKDAKTYYVGEKINSVDIPKKNIFNKMKLYFNKFKSIPRNIDNTKIDHKKAASDFMSFILDLIFIKYPKKKINKLILTAPVLSFDKYRVFLSDTCEKVSVDDYQILDEPTAVALGYDAIASPDYPYMIVDFGGGSLDINVIRLNNARKANEVKVLGKAGSNIGGSYIDNWILRDFLNNEGLEIKDVGHLKNRLMTKIEKLKIQVNNHGNGDFTIQDYKNDFEMYYKLSRNRLTSVLEKNYFIENIQQTIDNAIDSAYENGIKKSEIKKVFLVGGSSLLNKFKKILRNNFREKVIISEPFAAVINGACKFISGTILEDFLHHDYSIQHFNKMRGLYEYETIVPQKTKFPKQNVKQIIVATPFTGQEEIELKFFEVLMNVYNEEMIEDIAFDKDGNLIAVKDVSDMYDSRKVVPLNKDNKCFIKLDPPGIKSQERIKLTFHIDKNRILIVDAVDLMTGENHYQNFKIAKLK